MNLVIDTRNPRALLVEFEGLVQIAHVGGVQFGEWERQKRYNALADALAPIFEKAVDAQRALRVISLDPKIRAYLQAHDPKALEQVEAAQAPLPELARKVSA